VRTVPVDLSTPGSREVVARGLVINGMTVIRAPRNAEYYVKLGNNPRSGPFTGRNVWTFGSGVPLRDLNEGVTVENDIAVNAELRIEVSYA
jgi:hypothetical protein